MGTTYLVEPYDPDEMGWLKESGVDVPRQRLKPGRNPTPAEVRAVCDALEGFRTEYKSSATKKWWQALVEGINRRDRARGAMLSIDRWGGSESRRYKITFDNGEPAVVLRIVHGLTRKCGPLLVVPDSDDPLLVWPEADLKKLVRQWS